MQRIIHRVGNTSNTFSYDRLNDASGSYECLKSLWRLVPDRIALALPSNKSQGRRVYLPSVAMAMSVSPKLATAVGVVEAAALLGNSASKTALGMSSETTFGGSHTTDDSVPRGPKHKAPAGLADFFRSDGFRVDDSGAASVGSWGQVLGQMHKVCLHCRHLRGHTLPLH